MNFKKLEYFDDIQMLNFYIKSTYFDPVSGWDDRYIRKRSYQQWAANEIIDEICSAGRETTDPREVITDFISKMNSWILETKDSSKKDMFIIAKEVGESFLKLLN